MSLPLDEIIGYFDNAPSENISKQARSFRKKLYELLRSRSTGFEITSFHPWKNIDQTVEDCKKSFRLSGVNDMMDSSFETMRQLLPTMDHRSLAIMSGIIGQFLIDEDFQPCIMSEELEEEFEVVAEYANEMLERFDCEPVVSIEDVERTYKAAIKVSEGNYQGALANYEVEDFANAICDLFDNSFSEYYVLGNIAMFYGLFFKTECNVSSMICISSPEIKRYSDYKENLPVDIRNRVDGLIELLHNPFPEKFDARYDAFYSEKNFCILMDIPSDWGYDDASYTERDMQLPFYSAIEELNDLLPELRETYGSAEKHSHIFLLQMCKVRAFLPIFANLCY